MRYYEILSGVILSPETSSVYALACTDSRTVRLIHTLLNINIIQADDLRIATLSFSINALKVCNTASKTNILTFE